MSSARLEAFSDGVLAVAITLLALDLTVAGPHGSGTLLHQLHAKWPSFAGFGVSFFTIGVVWVNHHNLFKRIRAIDRALLFANLVLLAFAVLIPFVTATLAKYLTVGGDDAHLAAILYVLTLMGMGLSFGFIFVWSLRRGLMETPLRGRAAVAATVRFTIGNAAYVVCLVVAFFSAPLTLLLTALTAVYYMAEQIVRNDGGPGALGQATENAGKARGTEP
jgi:uncharacterized membrane protein